VHPDPSAIGTHFAADLAVACDPQELLAALGAPARQPDGAARAKWIDALGAERRKIATPRRFDVDDGVPFEEVVALVGQNLPQDAIVTVDAGTFGVPVYRVIPFAPPQRLLAPIAGAMGFGIPAAVAAGMREPTRPVICFVGDGGFLMTGNELATAIQYRLPVTVIVANNNSYGTIRLHQEKWFPGRSIATDLKNPDFARLAQAFGAKAFRIERTADIDVALEGALTAEGPSLVEVRTSLEHISAFTTLSALARNR
jgi:acetolactate synthase-1/2/3 large subunit